MVKVGLIELELVELDPVELELVVSSSVMDSCSCSVCFYLINLLSQDMFKGSRKSRSKSVQLLNKPEVVAPNQRLFDKALTLEQEGSMAKARR